MTANKQSIHGGCLCGALRYTVEFSTAGDVAAHEVSSDLPFEISDI